MGWRARPRLALTRGTVSVIPSQDLCMYVVFVVGDTICITWQSTHAQGSMQVRLLVAFTLVEILSEK